MHNLFTLYFIIVNHVESLNYEKYDLVFERIVCIRKRNKWNAHSIGQWENSHNIKIYLLQMQQMLCATSFDHNNYLDALKIINK